MSAEVQLDGGFWLWEIGFDEESFGLFTKREDAEEVLAAGKPPIWDGCEVRRTFVRTTVKQEVEPGPLTEAQWKEAFRRCCIITEWESLQRPSAATGPNGESWCPEAEQFDPVANALLLLDDDVLRRWNEQSASSAWLMARLLGEWCTECGRDLHGYQHARKICRYCAGEAE